MVPSLDKLILENQAELVDAITKDAARQIPSYRQAPLQQTIPRVERWLHTLAASLQENDPQILERYVVAVAHERRQEGYQATELHSIVQITEDHLNALIERAAPDLVARNALTALLQAVLDAAHMVISVNYVLIAMGKDRSTPDERSP